MKSAHFSYLLAALLLVGFYALFIKGGGFRLPVYYTPLGNIIPIGEDSSRLAGGRLLYINGQEATAFPVIFSENKSITVSTHSALEMIETVPNDLLKVLFDFIYFIAASFLFLFCALWFYHNTRDIHLVTLNFILSACFTLLVIVQAYHRLIFLWQFFSLLLAPALLNMGLRTTGRHLSRYLTIGEVSFILFLSFLVYVGKKMPSTLENLNSFLTVVYLLVILLVLALQLRRAMQKTEDPIEKLKRWTLFLGTLTGIFAPVFLAALGFISWLPPSIINYSILMVWLFPMALIYGTYRLQLTPFQIVFSRSIVAFLQGAFFVCIYGIALLIQNILLPRQEEQYQWIVHAIFILTLIFFLDPLKYFLFLRLAKGPFGKEERLEKSLQIITSLITSHRRLQTAVDACLEEIRKTLALEKTDILLSESAFPELHLRESKIYRISHNDHFWKYFQEGRIVVTDYLTYSGGAREKLFRFLLQNNYMLAIGLKGTHWSSYGFFLFGRKKRSSRTLGQLSQVKSALLIGYRQKHTVLKISETRYLYQAARLMNIMIQNYAILVAEIEKRQRIRELHTAGQLQRKLPEIEEEQFKGIRFAYSSRPAISVSGDYFDLIQLKQNRLACLLGDVSGHGLGSGYLASSLRGIVRSHLQRGATLSQTAQAVNSFFLERYQGNEFVTLVVFILNVKSKEVEYFNAAHPSPYLLKARSDQIAYITNFQPVIGILPRPYNTEKIQLDLGDRLFLYSDGVTETFNAHNVPFGEKRLKEFMLRHRHLDLKEVLQRLEENLMDFRGNIEVSDDISMAMLEFSSENGFTESSLPFLKGHQASPVS